MEEPFIHLNTHSHFSLLSGLPKIPELVAAAKRESMPAIALTDEGNLYGAMEFYKTARAEGIKPIIGVECFVAARGRADKQAGVDNRRTRLILLAKNEKGYRNLLTLVSRSHLEGFYYRPRVDRELLSLYAEGLIAIMPPAGSAAETLRAGDTERAAEHIAWHVKAFGGNNVFLGITHHPEFPGHTELMKKIAEAGRRSGVPLVAVPDVFYLTPDDKKARDTLLLVNSAADSGDRSEFGAEADFSFTTSAKARTQFKGFPEALRNTKRIADMCVLELSLGTWVFPNYAAVNGKNHDEELRRLAYEGLVRRGFAKTTEAEKRIEHELSIIKKKGYAPYFLVVADLLREAHVRGIITTTRGSAAGSLVSYLTGITNVDPLRYRLPFERFLNPDRPSPPDVDMDIADNRRDEMIEYARGKYGADRVAQIGTFGTMMARGAVRDIARALGYPYAAGDRIAKLIPFGSQGFPMSIDRAMELVPELATLHREDPEAKKIIDMAKKVEGCARHISVHAAGVVIAPTPLTDYVPIQLDPKGGKLITQYDMHAVEDAGLLKLDFLGIKNLAILADAVALAKRLEGAEIDIENIPLDDAKTYEMLARGETGGLFQLNGAGMTRFLKELRPTVITDINAMVALYRPGPMESIPEYIARKHNPRLVSYLDPRLKEILSESYGVVTYQDDVLLIAVVLAGYSWMEADKLRKAMGKKIPAEMAAQREKLIAGFMRGGVTKEKAEKLWKLIEPFAAYGFNKAHAASYGKVAYQTAYMKAHFPAIYMSAVLTADSGDVEKIGEGIAECKRMGIPVLPPSVNESFEGFTVVKIKQTADNRQPTTQNGDKIRFGLTTIKNFGEGIARSIIEERKRTGRFKTLEDFLSRVRDRNLNRKSLEALIKSGALDELGLAERNSQGEFRAAERGVMLANIETLLLFGREAGRVPENQTSLFAGLPNAPASALALAPAEPASMTDKLAWEKELLGLYLSGHPLDKWREKLEKRDISIKKVREEFQEGMLAVVGGIVEGTRQIITKGGEMMVFLTIADLSSSIEAVVFPRVYAECKALITPEKCIALKGRVSHRNGGVSIIAEKIKELG